MKNLLSAIFLLLCLYTSTWACLNEHEDTQEQNQGRDHKSEFEMSILWVELTPRDLKAEAPAIKKKAAELLAKYKKSNAIGDYQSYGVQLILLGRYDEALKVMNDVLEKAEDWYSVQANLGTLHELRGDNQLAYTYIKRALEINKDAHRGSEWIHLNILDIKRTHGLPISSQNLIGVDFGTDEAPANKLAEKKLEDLGQQIHYQLTERMAFIQPKDSIVAHLLFDLANVQTLLGEYELAFENYEWAKKYGFSGELLEQRIANTKNPKPMAPEVAPAPVSAQPEVSADAKEAARDEAFWEMMGEITFPAVACLVVGIVLTISYWRKRKA